MRRPSIEIKKTIRTDMLGEKLYWYHSGDENDLHNQEQPWVRMRIDVVDYTEGKDVLAHKIITHNYHVQRVINKIRRKLDEIQAEVEYSDDLLSHPRYRRLLKRYRQACNLYDFRAQL